MDLDNYTTKSYQKYLQYAVLAYRELQLQVEPKVSVHYFTPNSAGLAPLPPDFDFYTKVAMIIGGAAFTLTANDRIPLPKVECGVEVSEIVSCPENFRRDNGAFSSWFNFIPHYRAGNFVGEFYSLGGGWNSAGYFRIDWKNHQIVITGAPRVEYCMEYVGTGADDAQTLIPNGAVQYIRHYIHSQLALFSNSSEAEKQRKKNECEIAFTKYKDQVQIPTITEYVDLMYCGFQNSPKGVSI